MKVKQVARLVILCTAMYGALFSVTAAQPGGGGPLICMDDCPNWSTCSVGYASH